jgi:hypothetical protein
MGGMRFDWMRLVVRAQGPVRPVNLGGQIKAPNIPGAVQGSTPAATRD